MSDLNPHHSRWFRAPVNPPKSAVPAEARTTTVACQQGDEQGNPGSDWTEPDDDELEVTVRVALCSTYFPLGSVVVVVTNGRVLLTGRIPSFYLKQIAQEVVRRVPRVSGLENRLVVERNAATPNLPDVSSECDCPSLDNTSSR